MNIKITLTSLFIIIASYINAETPSTKSYWDQKKQQANTACSTTYDHKKEKERYLYETQLGQRYKFHKDISFACGGLGPKPKYFCAEICNPNDALLKEALIILKTGNQYDHHKPYEVYLDSVQKNEEAFIFMKGISRLSSYFSTNEWNKSEANKQIIEEIEQFEKTERLNKTNPDAIERFIDKAAEAEPAAKEARQRGITRLREEIQKYDQLYRQDLYNQIMIAQNK